MIERKAAYEGVEPEALSLQELMYIGLVQGGAVKLEEVVDDREAWTRNLNKNSGVLGGGTPQTSRTALSSSRREPKAASKAA